LATEVTAEGPLAVDTSMLDRSRLESDVFAFKKVIQTCLPAQTTWTSLIEAALFKLVMESLRN
jgi:hypothetical protein